MPQLNVPPHNEDAERSLLGAMLLDRDAIVLIAEITRSEHFYTQAHQHIYEAMIELYEARSAIDVVTLTAQLKKKKLLKEIGGTSYIAGLSTDVVTTGNVVEYAKIIKHHYIK